MERDLCANCDHWRESHYAAGGAFIADKLFGCYEYQGVVPTEERRATRDEDLQADRELLRKGVR